MNAPSPVIPTLLDPTAWAGRTYNPPLALDIATLQNAVVAKLAASFCGTPVGVFGFPQLPDNDWWREGTIGYLLVAYKRTEYSGPLSTSSMVQGRKLDFDIKVIAREAQWGNFYDSGVFRAMVAVAKSALTGFRPPGCRNGYLLSEGFDEQDSEGQLWDYSLRFRLTTMEIEQPNTAIEAALALLKEVRFLETGGLTPTAVPSTRYVVSLTGSIQLPNGNVSNVVATVPGTGVTYRYGTDYSVSTASGLITLIAGGAIAPGSAVDIAYTYSEIVVADAQNSSPPLNEPD